MITYFVHITKILPVDFSAAWWRLLWNQRWIVLMVMSGEAVMNIFNTLLPMLFEYVLSAKQWDLLAYLFILWISVSLYAFISRQYSGVLGLQCIRSIHFNAHQWFLRMDPIYHSRKESGSIVGKIEQSSRAYDNFIDEFSHDIIPVITGLITAIITVAHYNKCLSIAVLGMLIIVSTICIISTLLIIAPLERSVIQKESQLHAVSTENLLQAQLIRSSFASDEINHKLYEKSIAAMKEECRQWTSSQLLYTIIKFLYIGSVLILCIAIMGSIRDGSMSPTVGVALLVTYIRGTSDIIRLERPLRKTAKAYLRIKDLFTFIREFGKQTFPVLSTSHSYLLNTTTPDIISIKAHNLFFDYHPKAKIFDNHSFELIVPSSQNNKLYGIIGPSGSGKSTFLHIIGGQIKPASGNVIIDNTNIYDVNDNTRKKLIALQGQTASNLRGTLKYNLLFGIPSLENTSTDEQLVELLRSVGLWDLFEHKDGLSTFIGESGLNLSGGQRQRLYFANLYLRARHFNPALILIDEPTSSLDEVSERAITSMIKKLATNSVVLIIAHRLKTIEDAQGILDFSLLTKEQTLRLHSKQELVVLSAYYQELMRGAASLED
jgi:ATP-binding cassette, subfamily B, bacterial